MKSNNYRIGIIGGMGPQASLLLHSIILEAYVQELGAIQVNDYPIIVHVSLPVIDFIVDPKALQKNHELFALAAQLTHAAKLDTCIMACNSVHLILDSNPSLKNLPLVSLPESVIAEAKKQNVRRLGLIAAPTTIRAKLYEQYADPNNIQIIPIDEKMFNRTEKIIRTTIAGKAGKAEVKILSDIAQTLMDQGAEAIALGCTELSVISHILQTNQPYIDSLTAATNALLERIQKKWKPQYARG